MCTIKTPFGLASDLWRRITLAILLIATIQFGFFAGSAECFGQGSKTKLPSAKKAATNQAKGQKQKPKKTPKPEHVLLPTKDGVNLVATYFGPAAADGEKPKAIPFILLHDWEGNRTHLFQYATYLQSMGHAAIVPDLRGHGESVSMVKSETQLDASKFRKGEVASVQNDIEICKKYLVRRNNEGAVNIDMLSVVAVGKTSVLAVQWVLNDWFAFPSHNPDGIKQGRDVKSVVLVSPKKKLNGISMMTNIKHQLFCGNNSIPMMFVWASEDKEAAKDAESLFKLVEKARPDPSKIEDLKKREAMNTLIGTPINGQSHSGAMMMSKPVVNGLWPYTNRFINLKVKTHEKDCPWKSREKKEEKAKSALGTGGG